MQGFDRAIEQSLDSIRAKASWLDRDRGDVEEWLKGNGLLGRGGEKL
jgi:aminopeptidase 2